MHPSLQSTYLKLDQELEAFLKELASYSNEQLNQAPGPDKWSALQCAHHLMESEKLSLAYLRKKLSFNPTLKKQTWRTHWRLFLLNSYLRAPFKFKAPEGIGTSYLPETSSLEAVTQQWRNQRAALHDFLGSLPDDLIDKEVYKHPFAGRLPLKGMLQFFQAHFQRHRRQALRALKAH